MNNRGRGMALNISGTTLAILGVATMLVGLGTLMPTSIQQTLNRQDIDNFYNDITANSSYQEFVKAEFNEVMDQVNSGKIAVDNINQNIDYIQSRDNMKDKYLSPAELEEVNELETKKVALDNKELSALGAFGIGMISSFAGLGISKIGEHVYQKPDKFRKEEEMENEQSN